MLMRRQRLEEAAREVKLAPVEWERLTVEAQILWALGQKAESDAVLKRLISTLGEVAAYQIAQVYAHRRDNDRAFEWLERSAKQRDPGVALLRSDTTFTTLQDDPRWQAFLKKIRLTDEQLK